MNELLNILIEHFIKNGHTEAAEKLEELVEKKVTFNSPDADWQVGDKVRTKIEHQSRNRGIGNKTGRIIKVNIKRVKVLFENDSRKWAVPKNMLEKIE